MLGTCYVQVATTLKSHLILRVIMRSRSCYSHFRVVVQLLNHVRLFATPCTAARQASLSSTISRSFLKFMSFELVILSNHLILCHPLFLCLQSFEALYSYETATQRSEVTCARSQIVKRCSLDLNPVLQTLNLALLTTVASLLLCFPFIVFYKPLD